MLYILGFCFWAVVNPLSSRVLYITSTGSKYPAFFKLRRTLVVIILASSWVGVTIKTCFCASFQFLNSLTLVIYSLLIASYLLVERGISLIAPILSRVWIAEVISRLASWSMAFLYSGSFWRRFWVSARGEILVLISMYRSASPRATEACCLVSPTNIILQPFDCLNSNNFIISE